MGFIGVQPATVPLTSSDITDGIISTAKIADDAVGNTKLDLSANYAFTGTITGASDMVLLATSNSTSTVSEVDITLPTGYDSYYLKTMSLGNYSSATLYTLRIKIDGETSFKTSDYTYQGQLIDNSAVARQNVNSGGSYLILSHDSASNNQHYGSDIFLNGFGRTDISSTMSALTSKGYGASSTWITGGSHMTESVAKARVSEIRFAPANGSITHMYYKLYGLN
tara:strand:+ start:365 stop:1036 length:672 start_codon:yes stop_codon:yes gene_type:complete